MMASSPTSLPNAPASDQPSPGDRLALHQRPRIGIDLGGTKIAGIVLDSTGATLAEHRIPAPHGNYADTLEAIAALVAALTADLPDSSGGSIAASPIGVGMPGSISPATSRVQGANSTWLNGQSFGTDLSERLKRPVRLANDANCFALSEACDGAGAAARSVFGVIIGTGCGGGLVFENRTIDGPNAIAGEWGHTPLPWPRETEIPAPLCWCGRPGCLEMWVSGTGLAADHRRMTGQTKSAETIAAQARAGDQQAKSTLERHADRLARGLAVVIDIFDPEVIVLGGGLSNLASLYQTLPPLIAPWVFADKPVIKILPPRWGDASGVRGAARLW